MLESILVYYLTALMLYLMAKSVANKEVLSKTHASFWSPEIVASICLFGIIAGARFNVGVDYPTYYQTYIRIQSGYPIERDTFEPAFVVITNFMAKADFHYFFYFAFWAILQISFIYYALKDKKYLLPYIALCVMLNSSYFLNWMNGIRQCVAMCAFVFLAKFISERKVVKYVVGVFILTFIHKSAILLLPFYLLTYNKLPLDKKYINLAILVFFVVLGATPTWLSVMNNASGVLSFAGYENYSEGIRALTEDNLRQTAWGPNRISGFVIGICIIWFYPQMRTFYKDDKYLPVCFSLFLIGIYSYNAFVNTSHIFLRPIEYFTIFNLPLIAYLLYFLKQRRKKAMFYSVATLAFTQIFFVVYKSVMLPTEASEYWLYKFFFQ